MDVHDMKPNTSITVSPEAKRNEDTVAPLVRLRYPSAASLLADIVELLEERIANEVHYCAEAVADARHDLKVLEVARLYKPNNAVSRAPGGA